MSNITLLPSAFKGEVSVPPSKSEVHRAIICAALCHDKSTISPVSFSEDILATIDCVRAMYTAVQVLPNSLKIDSKHTGNLLGDTEFYCRESGSTLRFIMPVAAALGVDSTFYGTGNLPNRPLGIYADTLPLFGLTFSKKEGLPLEMHGRLQSGDYKIPGNVSSQFISGLLLAMPLLPYDSRITLTSPLQSAAYVDLTIETMKKFGVQVQRDKDGFSVKAKQRYCHTDYKCEGDWSQAAFFMTGAAINGSVTVKGLNINSTQGDKACADILKRFGADVTINDNSVTVKAAPLHAIDINAENIPDLVPILSVAAALAQGTTHITGAARLRIKECDRLAATANMLKALGVQVEQNDDGLTITGSSRLSGGIVDGCNDHRMVMCAAVCAAANPTGEITVSHKESINKSYPSFFEDYMKIGGKIK